MLAQSRFERLVETYKDMCFRIAYGYLRSVADANDVVQDVFVKLWRSERTFEGDEHVRNWLVRVTVNECKSSFRAPWRRVDGIDDYAETLASPEGDAGADAVVAREVLAAVMRLPERYRVPVYLYYYEGYATAEIADILDVPDSTVRTRLARARRRLASVLEGDDACDA